MPCLNEGAAQYELGQARAENNKLTRLLCEVMGFVGDPKEGYPLSHELLGWWEAHQKADADRKAREAADIERLLVRQAAIAKLSPEERALLGIR